MSPAAATANGILVAVQAGNLGEPDAATSGGRLSVLVVEDEVLVLMSVVDMLDELGHEALEASNATAAMAVLQSDRPIHVLLTDINLPDMKGQELAQHARVLRPYLPIVFTTGYQMDVPHDLAETGPTAVLGKPYWMSELDKALRRVR